MSDEPETPTPEPEPAPEQAPPEVTPKVILETPLPCGCIKARFSNGQDGMKKCLQHAFEQIGQALMDASIGARMAAERLGEVFARQRAMQQQQMQQHGHGPGNNGPNRIHRIQ